MNISLKTLHNNTIMRTYTL